MTHYTKSNPTSIRALFNSIAPRYDLGNAVLSGNLHRLWNRRLATSLLKKCPTTILDLCCGTGEIAKRMICTNKMSTNQKATYHLVDFSEEMLAIAKQRLTKADVMFYHADAEELPLADSTFDAAACAYGIRNIQNRTKSFLEVSRVLKPGATFGIVELTRPSKPVFSFLHKLYLRTMVPLVGRAITSNENAYKYLRQSIELFVPPGQIVKELSDAGFTNIQTLPQTFGIATIFLAEKP